MNFTTLLECVPALKNMNLPAESSLLEMAPPYRNELILKQKENIKNAKQAAVLALLYPCENNITHLVLILRKTYKGVHSAQVGFPGGKVEETDVNLEQTALREAHEEVGVNPNTISVLKQLTSVYIPPSNYNVQPFLGVTDITPTFIKEEEEVEDILEIRLSDFLDDKNVTTKAIKKGEQIINVPAFDLGEHLVWGATAMMLNEIKQLLKNGLNQGETHSSLSDLSA